MELLRERLRDQFGDDYTVAFDVSYYQNGSIKVCLLCDGEYGLEPYATLTIDPESLNKTVVRGEAFIKNYSENVGLDIWLVQNGFADVCPIVAFTPFGSVPRLKFNIERLREYDPEGVKRWETYTPPKKKTRRKT